MKKVVKTMLMLALATAMVWGKGDDAKAAVKTTELIANQEITDKLYMNGENDPNVYNFTVTNNGYVNFVFTGTGRTEEGVFTPNSNDWCDYKILVNGKEYEHGTVKLKGEAFNSDVYSFKEGTVISVQMSTERKTEKEYFQYKIKAVTTQLNNNETEINDSKKQATKLKAGKNHSAVLTGKNEDTDWFVFKAKKAGKYKISMTAKDYRWNTGVQTYIYCTVKKGSKTIVTDKEVIGGEKAVTLFKGNLKKGQKVYIKAVQGSCAYHSEIYNLKVKKY
ncbi:hypothetical protein [Butyrivibrio sp. FC2001]|uniref:hypothetical protein n=1 Tax=Butyrivibrio sp. FC2001 TaxID=1280671 RepID=UPI00041F8BD8|nr:hypothetical protein [Butyrivibrio sp. FC2001]